MLDSFIVITLNITYCGNKKVSAYNYRR